MRLNKKSIESGLTVTVKGYEIRVTLDGYYEIYSVKNKKAFCYSNYDLMRRCLTDLLK